MRPGALAFHTGTHRFGAPVQPKEPPASNATSRSFVVGGSAGPWNPMNSNPFTTDGCIRT